MGNGSDALIVSKARDQAAIHNLEDASFGPGCGIRSLIEYASHLTVALWRAVAVVRACTLIVARTCTDPRGETFLGGKRCCGGAHFAMICCAESTPFCPSAIMSTHPPFYRTLQHEERFSSLFQSKK